MSNIFREKNSFPEKDLNKELTIQKLNQERENIRIYDNDDAYMLNFNKENDEGDDDPRQNVSDLDNYDKYKNKESKEKNNLPLNNLTDELDEKNDSRSKDLDDQFIPNQNTEKNKSFVSNNNFRNKGK